MKQQPVPQSKPSSPLVIDHLDEVGMAQLGNDLATALRCGDLILLRGDLGAGKTFLSRSLIRALAEDEFHEVPSPTFTLAQVYGPFAFGSLTHLDLYRLEHEDEVYELGLDQALVDGAVLVEWPDKGGLRDEEAALTLSIDTNDDDARRVVVSGQIEPLARFKRSRSIRKFLNEQGFPQARRAHLTGDASSRAYESVYPAENGQSVILMNAVPQPDGPPIRDGLPYSRIAHLAENMRAFEGVDLLLSEAGLRVPDIHGADHIEGLLIIENLGTGTIVDDERRPIPERYFAAIELLAHLHGKELKTTANLSDGTVYQVPTYDQGAMAIEVDLLPSWYVEHVRGAPLDEGEYDEFNAIWNSLIKLVQRAPRQLVLRDYHSPNIIWIGEAEGFGRLGLIDFQDAVIGPAAYDVGSLVQDARIDMSEDLEHAITDHYCQLRAGAPGFDEAEFREELAIMAAQRVTKILGIFVRLSKRDGKHGYLAHLPRMKDYLDRNLRHPVLGDYKNWMEKIFA